MNSKEGRARGAIAAVAIGVLLSSFPVTAHHSIASEYDFSKEISLTGVLTRVDWINPHSALRLQVTAEDGTKVLWIFQTAGLGAGPSLGLRRAPKDGGLVQGGTYTLQGFAARNGKPAAFLKALILPDGKVVTTWFGDPNG